MDRNQAQRMAMAMMRKKSKKKDTASELDKTINNSETRIAMAVDFHEDLNKHNKLLQKLADTKDVTGFLQDAAPLVASEMLLMALKSESEKIKLEASKDFLDRAGYKPVTKHAVARFDASSSKEEILSTIMGSKKDLNKVGIEIIDDEDNEETTGDSDEG